jgi:2'-5' RNA ligase
MTDRVFVTVLRFDDVSERHIRNGSAAIARRLGRTSQVISSPHLSLVPTDVGDEQTLVERLADALSAATCPRITLSHSGWFPSGVLFLGATPTRELLEFHACIHCACAPSPHAKWIDLYKPGAWVPHCTLAMDVPTTAHDDVQAEAIAVFNLPMAVDCRYMELLIVDGPRTESLHAFRLPPVPE